MDWEDDDGFEGYVETTVDPGPWVIVGTTAFCALSILLLPCMLSLGRRYEKRCLGGDHELSDTVDKVDNNENDVELASEVQRAEKEDKSDGNENQKSLKISDGSCHSPSEPGTTARAQLQALVAKLIIPPYPDDDGVRLDIATEEDSVTLFDTGAGNRNRQAGVRRYQWGQDDKMWQRERLNERRLSLIARDELDTTGQSPSHSNASDDGGSWSCTPTASNPPLSHFSTKCTPRRANKGNDTEDKWSTRSSLEDDAVSPSDAIDVHDVGKLENVPKEDEELDLCCGANAWWRLKVISSSFDSLLDIVEYDREMRRILKLSIPFSLAAFASGGFETVRVALVANFIGTEAVAAYTIVLLILGLTQEFFGGFGLASASLCAHAVGRENFKLAGEYVQISWILYTICYIPNVVVWVFFTDDVVRLFGFNDTIVEMAQQYARFLVFAHWFEGLDEAYGNLLSVMDHERFVAFAAIANEITSTCLILIAVLGGKKTNLTDIGTIELSVEAIFFGFSVVGSNSLGWMKEYSEGIFRTNALRNNDAIHTVFKTALPLALGQLLQYSEWEILTIFVAALGTAEVTTWGIVGSLWDALEALTEGFGDAAEIRVGHSLGAGRPEQARLSSFKSILVSVFFASLITSTMWIVGEDLALWLTPDPTLQRLIVEVLPLLGIGNIAMTAGTVSWALVGGQGRYRLATSVAMIGSWLVTLPLAAVFTYAFNIDIQGVTSAIVIGNSVTGAALTYILLRSDWTRLSRHLMELNAESDDSSSSSSGSSSSSSSSSESLSSSSESSISSS